MNVGTKIALSAIGGLLAATTIVGAATALPHAIAGADARLGVQHMQPAMRRNGMFVSRFNGNAMHGNVAPETMMRRQGAQRGSFSGPRMGR